jgi:hypothetical protein
MSSQNTFKSFAARKAEIFRRNRWIYRIQYNLVGPSFLGTGVPFWFLLVCVLLVQMFFSMVQSQPIYVFCDQKGMAFAKFSDAGDVPWMMTREGAKRGDWPGAMYGTQMTCDEAIKVFDMRPSELQHEKQVK